MRAGRRSKKVIIQRTTSTRGAYGETVEAWATLSQPFVNIKARTGQESLNGGQIDATVTHLITLRKTDVNANDRILHGTRVFDIKNVLDPEERGFDQTILAIENV